MISFIPFLVCLFVCLFVCLPPHASLRRRREPGSGSAAARAVRVHVPGAHPARCAPGSLQFDVRTPPAGSGPSAHPRRFLLLFLTATRKGSKRLVHEPVTVVCFERVVINAVVLCVLRGFNSLFSTGGRRGRVQELLCSFCSDPQLAAIRKGMLFALIITKVEIRVMSVSQNDNSVRVACGCEYTALTKPQLK